MWILLVVIFQDKLYFHSLLIFSVYTSDDNNDHVMCVCVCVVVCVWSVCVVCVKCVWYVWYVYHGCVCNVYSVCVCCL